MAAHGAPAPGRGEKPWDLHLVEAVTPGSLVGVARDRRLLVADGGVPRPVDLTWVDEAALALVDHALTRNRELVLVYPAPAGQVAVLLAAQILIRYFVSLGGKERVGLVTASTREAAKLWRSLRLLRTSWDRVPIEEVFPCWRAGPDGSLPERAAGMPGVIVGRTAGPWGTRATVVDHLAGRVWGAPEPPTIHVIADPMDPMIQDAFDRGAAVWGWSESSLATWHEKIKAPIAGTVPFSVTHGRLAAMAAGVRIRARVCPHPDAAAALLRLREDLVVLRQAAGATPEHRVASGLRIAWAHASTLASLPVRPSRYDPHATGPPRAGRPTHEFAAEIRAWARTLEGDLRDFAEFVASDMEDLRRALEQDNPLLRAIAEVGAQVPETLIVLRNRTAERALREELGEGVATETAWFRSLHRHENRPRALVPGTPPRSAWHHLDGGLATVLEVAVVGEEEAVAIARARRQVRAARARWGSPEVRAAAWRALVGSEPPPAPVEPAGAGEEEPLEALTGPAAIAFADPFSPLGDLLADDRPLLGESLEERVARADADGAWAPDTEAVTIGTSDGRLLVPPDRLMDRIVAGDRLDSVPAIGLAPGDRIVIGRREGRLRLVEALEERMRDRPDLWAAHLLVEEFRESLMNAFLARGHTVAQVHEAMRARGSGISRAAVASWLRFGDVIGRLPPGLRQEVSRTLAGPLHEVDVMGPQQTENLRILGEVLDIPLVRQNLKAVREALARVRGFRRAAGRALARAASAAAATSPEPGELAEFGIDLDDLREAVLVTTVVAVETVPHRVPWSEIGRLVSRDE